MNNESASSTMTPNPKTGLGLLPRQGSRHLIAFDLSDFVRRAWHGHVNEHRNEPERAAPTALRNIARVLRGQQPTHAIFAGEGMGSIRKAIFAGYKADRPEKPAGLLRCEAQVDQALATAGASQVRIAGLEADDVLAGAILASASHGWPVIIATRDKDAEVLVADQTRPIVVWRGGEEVLDDAAVQKRWGIPPHRISELLAIMGDSTDNVPGGKGLGKVAAVNILNGACEHISVLLRDGGTPWVPRAYRKKWLASREAIAVSWELTRLRGEDAARRIHFEDLEIDALRVAQSLADSADMVGRGWSDDGDAW